MNSLRRVGGGLIVIWALVATVAAIRTHALGSEQSYVAQARRYLIDTAGSGWSFAPLIRTGSLEEGDTDTFALSLERGVRYRIAGQCDNDCTDLDLYLFQRDREIDSDIGADDYPLLYFRPETDGNYSVRVKMHDCKADPCGYAIGVLQEASR